MKVRYTVPNETSRAAYVGNGSTTVFSVPFAFFDNTDLTVFLVNTTTDARTAQALTTNYTVAGGDGTTGTLTMLVAPATGYNLVIERDIPFTQNIDYQQNDGFPAEVNEEGLDRTTMLAQQAYRRAQQSPKMVDTYDPDASAALTVPLPVDGNVLVGKADASGWENATLADLDVAEIPVVLGTQNDGDLLEYDASAAAWRNVRNPPPYPLTGPNATDGEIVIMNERYDGFPKAIRVPGQRRIGTTINSTIDHTGSDNLASIKVSYSDDSGATWSTPVTIFGGVGLDCYTNAVGVDRFGVIHFWCRERNSGNKLHRTTRDWVTFSDVDTITSADVTGGNFPADYGLAYFRFWGKFEPNPKGEGMVGGGYWLDGLGNFRIYYVTFAASGATASLVQIASSADPPAYNETAHVAATVNDRLAFVRRNGTASPTIFRSADAGATWTNVGDMNIPVSGGWLPQEAWVQNIGSEPYVHLLMGHRRPSAAGSEDEPYPGPGVGIWYCKLSDALSGVNGWKMGHSHTWAFDATYTTDSYCSRVYDPLSGATLLFSYDELSLTSAKTFMWRAYDIYKGARTPDDPAYAKYQELGTAAFQDRRDIIGDTVVSLSGTRTVTPNEHGKAFVLTTTDALTLPAAASCAPDFFIEVKARGATGTVSRAGSDTINGGTSLSLTDGAVGWKIRRSSSTAFEAF